MVGSEVSYTVSVLNIHTGDEPTMTILQTTPETIVWVAIDVAKDQKFHFGGSLGGPIIHGKLFYRHTCDSSKSGVSAICFAPGSAWRCDSVTGSTYAPAPQLVPFYLKMFSLYGNTGWIPLAYVLHQMERKIGRNCTIDLRETRWRGQHLVRVFSETASRKAILCSVLKGKTTEKDRETQKARRSHRSETFPLSNDPLLRRKEPSESHEQTNHPEAAYARLGWSVRLAGGWGRTRQRWGFPRPFPPTVLPHCEPGSRCYTHPQRLLVSPHSVSDRCPAASSASSWSVSSAVPAGFAGRLANSSGVKVFYTVP